jgi:hypothetical protein
MAPAPPMAPWRGGIRAVAALGVAKCKAMPPGHAVDARPQERLPTEMRQRLLDAIYARQSFRRVLRDLGLTSTKSGE